MSNQKHLFHIVDASPWPFLTSFSVLNLFLGAVLYMHSYSLSGLIFSYGLLFVIVCMAIWWRDVIREATFEERHQLIVQKGLRLGMILFILSEVMFFFGFFWAFFHSSLAPTIELGSIWPPLGIDPFRAQDIPFVNTLLLLISGVTITWAHNSILVNDRVETFLAFLFTIILAFFFTMLQLVEYKQAAFNISDGVYGSTFYMATGFHGLHVLVGTIFISVCFYREFNYHFKPTHHFGFEAAAWYWHFVDVVWLFLFVTIYGWGSL